MKKVIQRRDPEIGVIGPEWCHHHGSKMRVEKFDKDEQIIIISGSAAKVEISRRIAGVDVEWFVDWEVIQNHTEKTKGCVIYTSDDLLAAFGLSDESSDHSVWLIERFGADSARQGKYIRWKEFLNIPCPGTGHDGDPNISIHLDEQMVNAVRQLLGLE